MEDLEENKNMYKNTEIYKLCCNDLSVKDIYIGSSCNFNRRQQEHRYNTINENSQYYNYKVYQEIRKNGGWYNWKMVVIEKYPCENKKEKLQRERFWMEELFPSLNSIMPYKEITDKIKLNIENIKKTNIFFICDCKSKCLDKHKNRHYLTKKHKNFIKNNTSIKLK